jgi:hypothetical protein
MSDHTPGPWTLHEADERDDDGTRLFNIHPVEGLDYIREAEARLIAAAPDLLAALENLVEETYECDQDNPHVAVWCITHQAKRCTISEIELPNARAAIAKARGRA